MINTFSSHLVGSSSTVPASTSASTSTSTSTSTSSSSSSPSSHSSKTNVGAIAGGIIGCVVGGALISALLFWLHTKRKASRPDPGMSPRISEHKMMDSPPSTGFSAIPSPPPSTNTSAVPSPPWTDTTAMPSPSPTNSPTPVQQVYQDALQKTYASIRSRHLTLDTDTNLVGSRRYPYILHISTVQGRGPARATSQHGTSLGSSWTILR